MNINTRGRSETDSVMRKVSHDLAREEDEEGEEGGEIQVKLEKEIFREVALLPPLLPLKFGNGLLLQYTVNTPGEDDKLGLLELGLATGLTSFGLVLISAVCSYVLKSAPLVLHMAGSKRKVVVRLLQIFNACVAVVQVGLLVLLFLHTASHFYTANFDDTESPHHVKKRIFMFSLIVSCVMFFSALLTMALGSYLYCRQDTSLPAPRAAHGPPPPARSLLPLGLANALLGLYIAIPGDDRQVVGSAVFLLDLCLYMGTVTIVVTVLEATGRIALLAAMRDGVLDTTEERMVRGLHLARYAMAALQLTMFLVMFGHCMDIYSHGVEGEYLCPRNLLLICSLLSSVILVAAVLAAGLAGYLVT